MSIFLQPIYTQAIGAGGVSTVTFNNIPQTFTDLKIVISERASVTDIYGDYSDFIIAKINGDNGSNYSTTSLRAATSVITYRNANDSSAQFGLGNGPLTGSNTFGNTEIYIPNYAGSNFKTSLVSGVSEDNSNASTMFRILQAGLWRNTSPVTSLSFTSLGGGNFVQYSTFSLYGITKG
jgi:hypothetical protein